MKFRAYDKPLVYNLSLVNDWAVFGHLKFNEPCFNDKCLKIWYELIRQIEVRNKGQWLLKVEGDDTRKQQLEGTNKHIHFLLAEEGMKKQNNQVNYIKHIMNLMSDMNPFWSTRPQFSHGVRKTMSSASFKVEPYNKELGARYYISKICYNDAVNLNTRGFDSGEHCCWKLSHKLKQRMRRLNENNEKPCYH